MSSVHRCLWALCGCLVLSQALAQSAASDPGRPELPQEEARPSEPPLSEATRQRLRRLESLYNEITADQALPLSQRIAGFNAGLAQRDKLCS